MLSRRCSQKNNWRAATTRDRAAIPRARPVTPSQLRTLPHQSLQRQVSAPVDAALAESTSGGTSARDCPQAPALWRSPRACPGLPGSTCGARQTCASELAPRARELALSKASKETIGEDRAPAHPGASAPSGVDLRLCACCVCERAALEDSDPHGRVYAGKSRDRGWHDDPGIRRIGCLGTGDAAARGASIRAERQWT